jgi:hypothetical protein
MIDSFDGITHVNTPAKVTLTDIWPEGHILYFGVCCNTKMGNDETQKAADSLYHWPTYQSLTDSFIVEWSIICMSLTVICMSCERSMTNDIINDNDMDRVVDGTNDDNCP